MFAGDRVANLLQLLAGKLDQLVALLTVKMIVLRVAVIVLINGPARQIHFPQQPRLDHLGQRPVDGRPADLAMIDNLGQIGEQLVSVEMLMPQRDLLDDDPPLDRHSLSAALQELGEPLERLERDLNRSQREILRHNGPVPCQPLNSKPRMGRNKTRRVE